MLGAMVAAAFGLGVDAVRSDRRGCAEASFARQVAMYLTHTRLGYPYAATGRLFGRDRTTARHACRQVEDRREDPRVDSLLDCLERALDLSVDLADSGRAADTMRDEARDLRLLRRIAGAAGTGPADDQPAVDRLLRRGLVAREDGRLTLTVLGVATLRRHLCGADGFAAQHQSRVKRRDRGRNTRARQCHGQRRREPLVPTPSQQRPRWQAADRCG